MKKKKKKIVSKIFVRNSSSSYLENRWAILRALQALGIIVDINMRAVNLEGKIRWGLFITCEVDDES